jgi:hypothetical protein
VSCFSGAALRDPCQDRCIYSGYTRLSRLGCWDIAHFLDLLPRHFFVGTFSLPVLINIGFTTTLSLLCLFFPLSLLLPGYCTLLSCSLLPSILFGHFILDFYLFRLLVEEFLDIGRGLHFQHPRPYKRTPHIEYPCAGSTTPQRQAHATIDYDYRPPDPAVDPASSSNHCCHRALRHPYTYVCARDTPTNINNRAARRPTMANSANTSSLCLGAAT